MNVRKSHVKIIYEGKNITGDITPDLLETSFTDNLDKADIATFTLRGDKWIDEWAMLKGDRFELEIEVSNWRYEGDNRSLKCGTFSVDEISFSGTPDRVSLSGTSIDITKGIRGVAKIRSWENISLKEIAKEIATENGLGLHFDIDTNFIFNRIEQQRESDTKLLLRLCRAEGAGLKVLADKLVIFDEEKYEKVESVLSFSRKSLDNYDLKCGDVEIYDKCEVSYYDSSLGEVIKGSFEAPDSSLYKIKTGKILYKNIDTGVTGSTKEEKEKYLKERARKLLREKNKHETKIKISEMGDTSYHAGMTAKLTEFGRYSGVYLITSVEHTLNSGYRCSISTRRRVDY